MKISNKISLSFILTAIFLALISVYIVYGVVSNDLLDAVSQKLNMISISKAEHIRTFFDMQEKDVSRLAQNADIRRLLQADTQSTEYSGEYDGVRQHLLEVCASDKDLARVRVVDASGKIVISNLPEGKSSDVSADPVFTEGRKDTYVGNARFLEPGGGKVVEFSMPVVERHTSRFLGVIVYDIKMDAITRIVTQKNGLGKTGEMYVVNDYDQMITSSRFMADALFRKKAANTEYCKSRLAKKAGNGRVTICRGYRGVWVFRACKDVPGIQWHVIADIDKAEAFAPLIRLRFLLTGIVGMCVFGAWVIGTIVSKIITGPIDRLSEEIRIVGRGKLHHKVAVTTNDEIGEFSREFNRMTENLTASMTSLENLRNEIKARKKAEKKATAALITLKQTQMQLIQSVKMATVGQLASGVAHEIRNPLAIINQCVENLERKVALKEEERFKKLEMIKRAVSRANKIIHSLLDFSRPASLKLESCGINEIIETSLQLAEKSLTQKNIKVIKSFAPELPLMQVDRNQMQQVFINVIVNSMQAMSGSGELTIRTRAEVLTKDGEGVGMRKTDSFKVGDTAVICEIEDTGPGIPEDQLDEVFNPFYTTKPSGKGTGLGLSVTKSIIEKHHGVITMASQEGQGTKVTAILPIDDKNRA